MINLGITVPQRSSIKCFLGGSIVEIMLIKERKSMKNLKIGDQILGDIIIQKNSSFFSDINNLIMYIVLSQVDNRKFYCYHNQRHTN